MPIARAEGNRFSITMNYSDQPIEGSYTYPFRPLSQLGREVGRLIHPSEASFDKTLCEFYSVHSLQIVDKLRRRGILGLLGARRVNALSLIPNGWDVEVVKLHPSMFREMGVDLGYMAPELIRDVYRDLAKQIPIMPFQDTQRIGVPLYRFHQDQLRTDETAEQIVYTIGLAAASPDRIGEFDQVHAFARGFLERTLGEPLYLTKAR